MTNKQNKTASDVASVTSRCTNKWPSFRPKADFRDKRL